MTVGNISEGASSERSGPFYVRLQNLPVSAGQKQIREFFSDLIIPNGGVSIHQNCAFVVFDFESDAAIALSKDKELFDGKKVRISNAVLKDVRRTKVNEARKKLVFSPPEQMAMLKQKKRIRPTKVKDCSAVVASKKFCPDEIEFPVKNQATSLSLDIKASEIKLNNDVLIRNGLIMPDEKVHRAEAEPCQYKVHKYADSSLILGNNFDEVDLNDKKTVENVTESILMRKFNSEKNESWQLEENVFVKESGWRFLDEKVTNVKEENFFTDENHSRKIKLDEKITGQAANSAFPKKVRDVTNRIPTKKTIKPTSVLSLNSFKRACEGTVF